MLLRDVAPSLRKVTLNERKSFYLFMMVLRGRVDALLFGHEGTHVDFSRQITGHVCTKEYAIPCILCNGNSTGPRLPARVTTIEAGADPAWHEAPWRSRARATSLTRLRNRGPLYGL